jgi:hypothetical protein
MQPRSHMPRIGCATCTFTAGYYPAGGAPKTNAQAQIDMIEETLQWAGVASVKSVSNPDKPMGWCLMLCLPTAAKSSVSSPAWQMQGVACLLHLLVNFSALLLIQAGLRQAT